MKKFKTIALAFTMLLLSVSLAACSTTSSEDTNASSASSSQQMTKVSVKVIIGEESKDYTVEKDSSLLDLAKKELKAVEEGGLINSVQGMESDPDNNAYLMFKVNGEDSLVGAADVELKEGDEIEFYISKF